MLPGQGQSRPQTPFCTVTPMALHRCLLRLSYSSLSNREVSFRTSRFSNHLSVPLTVNLQSMRHRLHT